MKKLLLFIIVLSLNFITSCVEEDNYTKQMSSEKELLKREVISLSTMNKQLSQQNLTLPAISNKSNSNSFITEVDTTNIIKLSTDSITSYTIKINTKSNSNFSNLIVKVKNNKVQEYIVNYSPSENWLNSYKKGIKLPYEGDIEVTDKIGNKTSGKTSESCSWHFEAIMAYGCDCASDYIEGYVLVITCSSSGSGSGSSWNGGSNGNDSGGSNPGGGGAGGGGGIIPPDGLPTEPIFYSIDTQRLATYIYFNDFEKQWLTDNPIITDLFLQLLEITNNSDQSKSQIKWVTSYLSNNTSASNYFNQNPQDLIALFNFQKYGDEFLNIWINDFLTNVNEYSLNNEFYNFQFDYRTQMSQQELNIFNSLSPQTQFKYLKNAYFALNKAQDLYPNSIHNGKGDAFRHAYFNALNVISIGKFYAEQLSTAHENKPPEYSYSFKENNMDLFNNKIGRDYGELKLLGNSTSVENLIKSALQRGELRYLTPLGDNRCPLCANQYSQLTPTNL